MTTQPSPPFLFISPTPHIGELSEHHQKLLDELNDFDLHSALACVSGLLTVPDWQSSTLRLEVLQHFIVLAASGPREVTRADIQRWLTDLGKGMTRVLEDPAEDVFVSRVLGPDEDYLIFEGLYESAAFYAQRFVNVLDEMPNQGDYLDIRNSVYGLLRLSNEIARRSNVSPFMVGGSLPVDHVSDELLSNLPQISQRCRFTLLEMRELGVDLSTLALFSFDLDNRALLADDTIGQSTLERFPLVHIGDCFYFALPTAASMAIRRMVFEACTGENMESMLYAAYKRETLKSTAALPLLGGSIGTPVRFQKVKGIYVSNVARFVDEGRLLHVCVVIDDLTTYAATGMAVTDPDPSRMSEVINLSMRHVFDQFSSKQEFRQGVSLIVLCGWGRPIAAEIRRPEDDRWRADAISAPDLETLSWDSSFSALDLWRLLDGRDKLETLSVHLANINGLLNLYSWTLSLDGHLIPHSQLPDNYDPNAHLNIIVSQNALLDTRKRLASSWNLHQAQTWDYRHVKVRRETISSFFDEDKLSPLYVSMDAFLEDELAAVYETQLRNWWTRVETSSPVSRSLRYQLWHLTAVWIRRAAPVLEQLLPTLPTGPLLWLTHFADAGDVESDSSVPSLDDSRKALKFEVIDNVIHVHAGLGFIHAFRHATNVGEKLLVEFFARGAFVLADVEVNEEAIAAALEAIVPDEWARDMHLMRAREFRDFVREKIPSNPILISEADDAYFRIGLGWRSRNRDEGPVVRGRDECCNFLSQVVDTLWIELRMTLKQYNREALLRQLIENHESVVIEKNSWTRSSRAMLSLHDDKEATALVSARRIGLFNGAALSSRLLLEMALCESPSSVDRVAGELDIARMLACAQQIHVYGGWSEAIHFEGLQPELWISPLGDVLRHTGFDERIANPYGEALAVTRFRDGATSYEKNYESPKLVKSAKNAIEPEFWQAWNQHFGFTIDEVRVFMDNIEDLGIEQKELAFTSNFEELLALDSVGKLQPDSLRSIVDALVLMPRATWDSTPEGFKGRDWYPWNFRRRLSVVIRPILQVSDGKDPRYLVAPGMVRNGVAKLIEYCHRGGLDAKDFPPGLMRSWIGAAENRRGHNFNEIVAGKLKSLGWNAKLNVRLTEILRAKTDKDYGDIDVLAWRDERILAIECKDLELAMTPGEIARQLYEFRGLKDSRGRPDRLKKHLLRIEVLKQRAAEVRKFTGSNDAAAILGVLTFSDIVPMGFSDLASKFEIVLSTIEELPVI